MPDIGGTYSRVSGAAPAASSLASSTNYNAELNDVATALNNRVLADGSGAVTADIPLGAHSLLISERTAPSSPAADTIAIYAKDNGSGTTHLYAKDHAGTEIDFMAGGTVGGSTGSTDNALLRADGTGGSTTQNSTVIVDDSGNLSGIGTVATSGNITINSQQALHQGTSGTGGQTIISGYVLTCYDNGNKAAGGSLTVDPSKGQHQKMALTSTGGTAVTITAPSNEGECILKILNNSGGTVTTPTFSSFDKVFSGDTFNTADGKTNWVFIYNLDGIQAYQIKNMN